MKKTTKNLALIRATVRVLSAGELETTGGGQTTRTSLTRINCTLTCLVDCITKA